MTLTLQNYTDTKSYLFNTTDNFERQKNYNLIIASLPKGSADKAVINSLLGVESTIIITFEITPRTDDYTVGTGTMPTDNDIDEEANWLMDTICVSSSKVYKIIRTRDSQTWTGTLADISIPEIGDQPNKMVCRLVFKIGVIPTL